MDSQCVHELCANGDSVLEKLGSRWWNDRTYKNRFGEQYHECQEQRTGVTHSVAEDSAGTLLDPDMGATNKNDSIKSPCGGGSRQSTKA